MKVREREMEDAMAQITLLKEEAEKIKGELATKESRV